MTKLTRSPLSQTGFSMIEVLVTIIVVSLGLLGFAGLQTYALKSNRIAMQRSLATMHAYSIIDCMRANRVAAVDSGYNQDYGATAIGGTVAGDDMTDWNEAIAENLPSGEGKITVAGTSATIWIRWKEGASASDSYIIWSTQTTL